MSSVDFWFYAQMGVTALWIVVFIWWASVMAKAAQSKDEGDE